MRGWLRLIVFFPEAFQSPAIRNPIAISLGAIAGALCRYYLSLWFVQRFGTYFPYGTLFVNITGSFLMGVFITLTFERVLMLSPEVILLISVGFLGSYTTFSSYELDSIKLINQGKIIAMGLYWLGSPLLGLLGIQLGVWLARLARF